MNEINLPITEQSNEITKNIDKSTSEEIINLFSKTDKQLFHYKYNSTENTALYDTDLLQKIEKISEIIDSKRNEKKFKIILSGCGTSGRLAYIAAKSLNEYLNEDLCEYIIAGDDFALINSVEAIEDSPKCGYDALKKHTDNLDSFIFIGITCGLSAPFVAGQIDYCLQMGSVRALAVGLIGFNPAELARKNEFKLEASGLTSTFHQLIVESSKHENFYLLNPLVGPEPITGSSRMKSGSATKVILDLIFLKFLFKSSQLVDIVNIYENLIDECLYNSSVSSEHLANLISLSSSALQNKQSISYVSHDMQIGVMGCVDASECIPTFGAHREDIRGFIDYEKCSNSSTNWNELKKFPETSVESSIFRRNETGFKLLISPKDEYNSTDKFYNLAPIYDNYNNFISKSSDKNELLKNNFFKDCLRFFLIKLSLNAISTASFVKQGKTYENYMIDVKASNFKLYKRAIHIINLLSASNEGEISLLKSIYSTDDLSTVHHSDYNRHIELAKDKSFVVSKAIIMNKTKCGYEEAVKQLDGCLTVRTCIENIVKPK